MRQRLKHPASLLLLPFSWSAFFLLVTVVPLLFPGRMPDDQVVAIALFTISWLLLLVPIHIARSKQPTADRLSRTLNPSPFSVGPFLLGCVLFIAHIVIHPIIGWFSYVAFWVAWSRSVGNTARTFESGPVRWLLPGDAADWKTSEELSDGWRVENERWRTGPLAHHERELVRGWTARLFGVERSGHRFVALSLIDRNGFLFDPFAARLIGNANLESIIESPPIATTGIEWPQRFLQPIEEE